MRLSLLCPTSPKSGLGGVLYTAISKGATPGAILTVNPPTKFPTSPLVNPRGNGRHFVKKMEDGGEEDSVVANQDLINAHA